MDAALLRALVEHQSAMLGYWDRQQRCLFANRAYRAWFGGESVSLLGQGKRDLLGTAYASSSPYIEGVLRGEAQEFEREVPDHHGGPPRHCVSQYIPDVDDGIVRGFFVLVTDVTRLKRAEGALVDLERRLQAREHLAALGQLAAGIAHAMNNPLARVTANLQLSLEALQEPVVNVRRITDELNDAREAAARLHNVVQSIKLLMRGRGAPSEPVDLREVLERSVELADVSIRYRARVERNYAAPAFVLGNPAQLAQVFVHLLTNAAQAIAQQSAGAGTIELALHPEGETVVVDVRDNGCGIPKELQAHIFEPFFTTRGIGEGLGLGLSISASIIRGLGGEVSVTSSPGEGSKFRVTLPTCAAPTRPAAAGILPRPHRPHEAGAGGRPRVLVIDDEPEVARVLARILGAGCDVVIETSSVAASQLIGLEPNGFDLIFCDLMMPDLTGDELYRGLVGAHPELATRFVFMTGGAFTPEGQAFLEVVEAPVLDKPFDVVQVRGLAEECNQRRSA